MRFGICGSPLLAEHAEPIGWDFIEIGVNRDLRAEAPDWTPDDLAVALPTPVANTLLPKDLFVVGPNADHARGRSVLRTAMERAARVGVKLAVFGSGKSRSVPDGFDPAEARRQLIEFARGSADVAADHGVTLVLEPLRSAETNTLTNLPDSVAFLDEVDHPAFTLLVDSYHFWQENEPIDHLNAAAARVRHVHVADRDGRTAPGLSGTSDYRPFFAPLKRAGYDGLISVESKTFDVAADGHKVLAFLKNQWAEA